MRQVYPTVHFSLDELRDWTSFHDASAEKFGFPSYYGRNLDAWIDCMRGGELQDGHPADDKSVEIFLVELPETNKLEGKTGSICEFLHTAFASVNRFRCDTGLRPLFVIMEAESPQQRVLEGSVG